VLKAANLIPQKRLYVISGVVLLLMISLVLRFFYLQIYFHETYKKKAEVNRIRAIPLNAPRGLILDRNEEIIVDNYPTYVLNAIPGEMLAKRKNFQIISLCTGIDTVLLEANYKKYFRGKFLPVRLAKDLSFDQLSRIEEHKQDLTGINYVQFPERYFPGKINAAHLLGYVKEVDQAMLKDLNVKDKYLYGDLIGWRGLEKVYEDHLRGEKGVYFVEVDAHGREMGLSTDYLKENAIPGKDLQTTLLIPLQKMLEQILDGKRGVVLVSLPETGEMLSMVSKPDYPPDLFTGATTVKEWQEIISNPEKPLLNRMTHGLYPPGSTLKIITAMTLMEKGNINYSETIDCSGIYEIGDRQFRCWKETGHGKMNLEQAITQSCNIYFYHVVQRLSLDEWSEACKAFGFGNVTNIDLFSEAKGVVPNSSYMNKQYGRWGWSKGHLLNLSLGQGELVVTPLQMMQYVNLLAMQGVAPEVHIVKDLTKKNYIVKNYSQRTWNRIEKYLQNVITSAHGTGKRANTNIQGLKISGKTGTAQNPHGEPHAWFIGYGEKDNELVSIVVLIENGGHGGETAAPIARRVFDFLFSSKDNMKLAFSL
jgi:penicillin-binding protein 2|tara:strand:- start:17783 stop:19558 length:1776 start_codon:yes stop_codon:yes gene_type:complete